MRIGSDNEFVEITELERAPKDTPTEGDVRVSVSVKLRDFSGKYDYVWLEQPILKAFVSTLTDVEVARKGCAELISCSPDEFTLTIQSRDELGHFVVEVSLSRYQYSGSTSWRTTVSGGFELEPTLLPSVVQSFRHLYEPDG